MIPRPYRFPALCLLAALAASRPRAGLRAQIPDPAAPALTHPLTLAAALERAEQGNPDILRAQRELEANYGVSMQIRSLALPKVKVTGDYAGYDAKNIEALQVPLPSATHRWSASVRLVQSVYEGGRIVAAVKSATLTKQQAVLHYQAVVADTILAVRTAYFDLLLADMQTKSMQAALELQTQEYADVHRRLATGQVANYDLLRAEVALASARPRLIRAQNQFRIGKAKFSQLLGIDLPADLGADLPLQLADPLDAEPYPVDLAAAVERALQNRPEINAQQKAVALGREQVTNARSGYLPSVQVVGGYGGFNDDLDRDIHGWFAGAEVNWYLFDGLQTQGKIKEAFAHFNGAESALSDLKRAVRLEVQVAYSGYLEARDVLEAQKKAQDLADEGLRLANSHLRAGELTQLDLMQSQTTVTQAQSETFQALRDYNVAIATLERAIGIPTELK